MPVPGLELAGIVKRYAALRPLRIRALAVQPGELVAVQGLDAAAAELLLNLITGATLPDEGEVLIFGESTAAIPDARAWFAWLDRFGIVSPRAVLLESLTGQQNLAMPFTLELDPVPAEIAPRVAALAAEVGLASDEIAASIATASPLVKARIGLARALALDPRVLLLEHPTASLPDTAALGLAADVVRVSQARQLTVVAMTEDEAFARHLAGRWLRLDAATGTLRRIGRWGRWF